MSAKTIKNKCGDCKSFSWARTDSGSIDRVCKITNERKYIMECCDKFGEKVYSLDNCERVVEVN